MMNEVVEVCGGGDGERRCAGFGVVGQIVLRRLSTGGEQRCSMAKRVLLAKGDVGMNNALSHP